jgi:hypothetical protein
MSPTLSTSHVLTIVMLMSLCKVGDEMELSLELCKCMPSTWSIGYLQPNLHSGYKTIVGNLHSNVSDLCFYWIKPYHSHNPKTNRP